MHRFIKFCGGSAGERLGETLETLAAFVGIRVGLDVVASQLLARSACGGGSIVGDDGGAVRGVLRVGGGGKGARTHDSVFMYVQRAIGKRE